MHKLEVIIDLNAEKSKEENLCNLELDKMFLRVQEAHIF